MGCYDFVGFRPLSVWSGLWLHISLGTGHMLKVELSIALFLLFKGNLWIFEVKIENVRVQQIIA